MFMTHTFMAVKISLERIKRNPERIKRNPERIKRNPERIKRNPEKIKRNPDQRSLEQINLKDVKHAAHYIIILARRETFSYYSEYILLFYFFCQLFQIFLQRNRNAAYN